MIETSIAPASLPPVARPALRRPELLAPAGDWECARAAVENGADAIYFGLERFNARMRAKNFTQGDLPALMEFLHRRGVKGYVTFNTLVFTGELADAEEYIRVIIAAGVDAAIVQDVGICRLIRKLSPDFPIHCSTQMTITSAAGVAFARDLGAQLVVLARENSLAEIANIQKAQADAPVSMPLEVFVHGALCVAYSGQCLTSESLGGRSANRGECAQACRLPYELISDGVTVPLGDRRYLLSPQDLSGLEVLPQLVEVGVTSLKIEGRLKSAEYVASITRIYRQALDRVMGDAAAARSPADPSTPTARYELEMSFSRGLSTGWFRGIDNQKLAHARFGTKRGVYIGTIATVVNESVSLRLLAPLKPGDGVVFDAGTPDQREEGGRVYEVAERGGEAVLRFGTDDLDWRRIRPGQRLWKTNDPALDRQLRATYAGEAPRFQRPLDFEVHGREGTPLTIVASDRCGHVVRLDSSLPLVAAIDHPLTRERVAEQIGRLGGTPFILGDISFFLEGNVVLPVRELNQLRRAVVSRLAELRGRPARWQLAAREDGDRARLAPVFAALANPPAREPELIAVIRLPAQLEAAWEAGARTIYCEFENPKHYRASVTRFRELAANERGEIWVAAPRIFKPGEEWILRQILSCQADGYLVRNYDHLAAFAGERRRGDFSLNVANPLTAEFYIAKHQLERVTASYDLNISQLEALLGAMPGGLVDITIHQHMPMFHMEHCVFCAFLSTGKDYRDCGRPCDEHRVTLRDRVGAELPLRADAGCRNTVYNNRAQSGAEYIERLVALGARNFRVEFVNEPAEEVARTLRHYRQLLRGEISGSQLWRELKLLHQLGVTRGQMETPAAVLPKKI